MGSRFNQGFEVFMFRRSHFRTILINYVVLVVTEKVHQELIKWLVTLASMELIS